MSKFYKSSNQPKKVIVIYSYKYKIHIQRFWASARQILGDTVNKNTWEYSAFLEHTIYSKVSLHFEH